MARPVKLAVEPRAGAAPGRARVHLAELRAAPGEALLEDSHEVLEREVEQRQRRPDRNGVGHHAEAPSIALTAELSQHLAQQLVEGHGIEPEVGPGQPRGVE